MKTYYSKILSFVLSVVVLSSCFVTEDPGPLREGEKSFSIVDFDRLEMGSAFIITVEQSETFSITATGDVRNLDDLNVYKKDDKLIIKFDDHHMNRKHDTHIKITMPVLEEVDFSGASDSNISGFTNAKFEVELSGASECTIDLTAEEVHVDISGASDLTLSGTAQNLDADISGASELSAFNLESFDAYIDASGASKAKVNVVASLRAKASGASSIFYRGTPEVTKNSSGSSTIRQD